MSGCAGARAVITADGAHYPISLTSGLRGEDGELVLTERLQRVGVFRDEHWAFATGYSAIPIRTAYDVSAEVNHQVVEAGGNAIANLAVVTEGCFMNNVFPLTLLPFWVGCSVTYLTGDIFRIVPSPPPVPEAALIEPSPAVLEVLVARKPDIGACVEKQHELDVRNHGELVVRWTVGPEGQALDFAIVTQGLQRTVLAQCLGELIRSTSFPISAASERVEYQVRF